VATSLQVGPENYPFTSQPSLNLKEMAIGSVIAGSKDT